MRVKKTIYRTAGANAAEAETASRLHGAETIPGGNGNARARVKKAGKHERDGAEKFKEAGHGPNWARKRAEGPDVFADFIEEENFITLDETQRSTAMICRTHNRMFTDSLRNQRVKA